MIYEITDTILSLLSVNVTGLTKVSYYSGEFESDKSEWMPVFPSVLISTAAVSPIDGADTVIDANETIAVYAAIKYQDIAERQVLSNLISFLNNLNFTSLASFPVGTKIMIKNIALHGFYFGIHIYKIDLETRIIME